MDTYTQLLVYLAAPAIIGTVTALIALWREFYQHKLHVAEHYVKKDDLSELKEDSKEMKKVMYQIAGKVGVRLDKE